MTEAVSNTPIDWVAIEAEYRAGVKSVRQIGTDNGCSHTAINKKAKEYGWTRDLAAKIRAAADAKVSKAVVSAEVAGRKVATESATVEANAQQQANVRLAHRGGLKRYWANIEKLQTTLDEADEPGEGKAPLNILVRATVVKRIGDALAKAVVLERQAYGITPDDDGGNDGDADFVERMLRARARAK